MRKTMTRPPLIALDAAMTEKARNVRTGRVEIWAAGSADGRWWFQRVEVPGTPWELTYLPTGQLEGAGSLSAARMVAADPLTLLVLRERAERVVLAGGQAGPGMLRFVAGRQVHGVAEPPERVAERLGLARRVLHILDGLVVAGDPDGVCVCGGLMVGTVHADACPECLGGTVAEQRGCRALPRHQACPEADPALCDHDGCARRAVPAGAAVCWRGRDWCCGCCADTL